MAEEKYFTIRIPKGILLYIYILLCIVVVVIAYNYWPRYVVLNPPMPDKGFILNEEKRVYNPYTDGGLEFGGHNIWTWRREYGFLPIGNDLSTPESVMAYFDTWLKEQGWRSFNGQGLPCDFVMTADHLAKDTKLFAYVSENTTGSYYSSVVCLATWPHSTADNKTGFTILLFSATK